MAIRMPPNPFKTGWSSKTGGTDVSLDSGPGVETFKFTSSWLDEGTWDPLTNIAKIRFIDGFVAIRSMSESRWKDLVTAQSPGAFWHRSEFM